MGIIGWKRLSRNKLPMRFNGRCHYDSFSSGETRESTLAVYSISGNCNAYHSNFVFGSWHSISSKR